MPREASTSRMKAMLTVPRVFQYSTTDIVPEFCFKDPLPVLLVVALLPLSYLPLCCRELCTAAHTDRLWHRFGWK